MQASPISFADRVAHNVRSEEYKDAVLRCLQDGYGLNVLSRHWCRWDNRGAAQLTAAPHWAALRSNGNPYYFLLTRFEGVNQALFVDVKIQPGYKYPRMVLVHGRFDDALFAGGGTVLHGEMVRCADDGKTWRFVVNDLIALGGAAATAPLPERLRRVEVLLRDEHVPDPIDPCVFEIKKYFPATADGLAAALAYEATLPYTCRGMYAWPLAAGRTPLLHNFDDTLVKDVSRKVKDRPDFVEAVPDAGVPVAAPLPAVAAAAAANPVDTNNTATKWLRKTEAPDVYDVHASNAPNSAHCGIAIVRTLASSRVLREAFKAVTVATPLPFACRRDESTGRWEPVVT